METGDFDEADTRVSEAEGVARQLRKSTVRPFPSVSRPSSSTWSRMLKTSGCAFGRECLVMYQKGSLSRVVHNSSRRHAARLPTHRASRADG
jgi:hypothetical protein